MACIGIGQSRALLAALQYGPAHYVVKQLIFYHLCFQDDMYSIVKHVVHIVTTYFNTQVPGSSLGGVNNLCIFNITCVYVNVIFQLG